MDETACARLSGPRPLLKKNALHPQGIVAIGNHALH
jgi:hypothetical protein